MQVETPLALTIALAYHDAWSAGDVAAAMALVADDVVCDAPAGRLVGIDAFRAFMGPFIGSVTRYERLAAYGDDTTAVVVYDTDTALVPGAPGAEVITISAGRIAAMRIIFDRQPFTEARAALAARP